MKVIIRCSIYSPAITAIPGLKIKGSKHKGFSITDYLFFREAYETEPKQLDVTMMSEITWIAQEGLEQSIENQDHLAIKIYRHYLIKAKTNDRVRELL